MKVIQKDILFKMNCENCGEYANVDKELQTSYGKQLMRMFLCRKCWLEVKRLLCN